jgi:hypothetical protein
VDPVHKVKSYFPIFFKFKKKKEKNEKKENIFNIFLGISFVCRVALLDISFLMKPHRNLSFVM